MAKRKLYSPQIKFKVALEAAKGERTRNDIASQYNVHPGQVTDWKKKLLSEGNHVFGQPSKRRSTAEQSKREAELYEQIGRLNMELEWLKKKSELFD